MLKSVLIAPAFALGALMVPAGPVAAAPPVAQIEVPNAKVSVGKRHHRRWHRHRHRRGWHRPHGFRLYIGPRHYYGRCAWLRHRAHATGSRYWWRRYRRCRGW
jgi:hypothetical protein